MTSAHSAAAHSPAAHSPAAHSPAARSSSPVRSLEVPADAEHPARHEKAPGLGERTPTHSPACFGCADLPHGLRMESWVDEDRHDDGSVLVAVRSRFHARDEFTGGPGVLHGGLLTTAFDEALGSVPTLFMRACVTARLETDFHRPVPIGSTVWLRSRLDGVVGRKFFVSGEARIDAEDGPVVGRARALFVEVGTAHFLRHGRAEDLEALGASAESIRDARG